ncbi:MAG: response regulator transcription factor [Phycisphaerales bacterium]|jgi:two-component system response regulator NreC
MTPPVPPHRPAQRRLPPQTPLSGAAGGVCLLCVDDHAFLVEGLKAQFSVTGAGQEFQVVGRLASAQDLIKEWQRLRPDIVVLDIEMPGPDPFEMADRLHRLHERAKIVFLSAYVRDHYIAEAYRCGACGYFSKADEITDIIEGLRQVARGGGADGDFVFGPKVKARCRPSKQRPTLGGVRTAKRDAQPLSRLETLSGRELEVLRLIGKGLSRNEIAEALSRSAKTIDRHQERMLKKLGLETRAELMRFAIREGLAEA